MAVEFSDDQWIDGEDSNDTQPSEPMSPQPSKPSEPVAPKASAPILPIPDVIKEQLKLLRTGDRDTRQQASRQLRDYAHANRNKYPAQIVSLLVEGLNDADWMVRWVITELLVFLNAREAKRYLLPLLKDPHPPLRITAVHAVALLGDDDDVEHITPLLTEKQTSIREAVVQALGNLGSSKAIQALLPYLQDVERSIRLYTIEALGKIGDKSVVDALLIQLKMGDESVRWVCVEALGRLADPRTIPDLQQCLDDIRRPIWDDKRVCDMTIDALTAIGTPEALKLVDDWRKKQLYSP